MFCYHLFLFFKNGKNSILERSYYSSGFKIFFKLSKKKNEKETKKFYIYRKKKAHEIR